MSTPRTSVLLATTWWTVPGCEPPEEPEHMAVGATDQRELDRATVRSSNPDVLTITMLENRLSWHRHRRLSRK